MGVAGVSGLLLLVSQWALATSEPEWVPDDALVARVDAASVQLHLPAEFGPVSAYARYYWGVTRHGHRLIDGFLVSPAVEGATGKTAAQRVNIVRPDAVPGFADGGCMFVSVEYDVEASALTQSHCNFDPQPAPKPTQ